MFPQLRGQIRNEDRQLSIQADIRWAIIYIHHLEYSNLQGKGAVIKPLNRWQIIRALESLRNASLNLWPLQRGRLCWKYRFLSYEVVRKCSRINSTEAYFYWEWWWQRATSILLLLQSFKNTVHENVKGDCQAHFPINSGIEAITWSIKTVNTKIKLSRICYNITFHLTSGWNALERWTNHTVPKLIDH